MNGSEPMKIWDIAVNCLITASRLDAVVPAAIPLPDGDLSSACAEGVANLHA